MSRENDENKARIRCFGAYGEAMGAKDSFCLILVGMIFRFVFAMTVVILLYLSGAFGSLLGMIPMWWLMR